MFGELTVSFVLQQMRNSASERGGQTYKLLPVPRIIAFGTPKQSINAFHYAL